MSNDEHSREDPARDESIERQAVRRYRDASAALDERPAASARAAVMAAAARQVGARPMAAQAPRRTRWPLAAAAAVMLSTLAVMLAIRTQDEQPQFEAPRSSTASSSVREQENKVAAQVSPVPAADPAPPNTADVQASRAKAPVAQRDAPAAAAPLDASTRDRATGIDTERQESPVQSTPKREDALVESGRAPAPAAPAARARASDLRESDATQSAAELIERIVKLRREGRQVEADAEVKRFRERFPQVQLPPEALRPEALRPALAPDLPANSLPSPLPDKPVPPAGSR